MELQALPLIQQNPCRQHDPAFACLPVAVQEDEKLLLVQKTGLDTTQVCTTNISIDIEISVGA
jgi:hypothetical protein